jgi:hypothetical protein
MIMPNPLASINIVMKMTALGESPNLAAFAMANHPSQLSLSAHLT